MEFFSLISYFIFFDYVYLTFDYSFIVIELCIRVVRYDNFFFGFLMLPICVYISSFLSPSLS